MTDRDDPEEFRALAHAVVDWIADYRAGIDGLPVQPHVEPGSVRAALTPLPERPQPFDALLAELDRVVVPTSGVPAQRRVRVRRAARCTSGTTTLRGRLACPGRRPCYGPR